MLEGKLVLEELLACVLHINLSCVPLLGATYEKSSGIAD